VRIAVIGAGYVGLTTGVCLSATGHSVICVDALPDRVRAIAGGQLPFFEPGLAEMLHAGLAAGSFQVASDLTKAVVNSDVTFVAVGTPSTEQGIDLSYIAMAVRSIGAALRQVSNYHVIVIKSTVVPGTTSDFVRPLLEETSGRSAGEFGLCMNPEFLREGSAVNDFVKPDRIVIGQWDEKSGQVLAEIYQSFDCPKVFTTLENAEMIKYASNTLLATLISFSNEIAQLCESTPNTDVEEVMQGVHLDRRLTPEVDGQRISPGILAFLKAGSGFGGSCLPKDLNALRTAANARGVKPHLLDAVVAINAGRPGYLSELAERVLGTLKDSTIAVLGLAFKPGTDDTRDSPALAVIRRLLSKGARVRVYDPMVVELPSGMDDDNRVVICKTLRQLLKDADAAVLVTAWPEFATQDWYTLCKEMRRPIIIDGRNALRSVSFPDGVTYLTIGKSPDSKSKSA